MNMSLSKLRESFQNSCFFKWPPSQFKTNFNLRTLELNRLYAKSAKLYFFKNDKSNEMVVYLDMEPASPLNQRWLQSF